MDINVIREHQQRVSLGEKAKAFLSSSEWKELVKPIIDSMIKGLVDIRDIKKTLLSSDKKAAVAVEARAQAAESLEMIEQFLNAYIIDAEKSQKLLEKQQNRKEVEPEAPLYKVT